MVLEYPYPFSRGPFLAESWVIKAERGFGLLARAAKPSETQVVYQSSHPSLY